MSEVIVITSGKGGVGKTTTTANLGMGLAMRGKKVVLVDTDTGLRNLDLLLGLENRIMYDLVDVTQGRVPYKKALVRHKKQESLFLLPTSQVKDKTAAQADPDVRAEVDKVAAELGDTGRILVRESGTEPLVRVMVEAKDESVCRSCVDRVVNVIRTKGHTL